MLLPITPKVIPCAFLFQPPEAVVIAVYAELKSDAATNPSEPSEGHLQHRHILNREQYNPYRMSSVEH